MTQAPDVQTSGAQPPEHARRTRARFRTRGLDWGAARWGRPLLGGGIGMAIVVTFLALRGGDASAEVNALTGTARGGWNREEDILLALVAGGAITVGMGMTFLAEYVRHWTAIFVAALMGSAFLALRELRDFDSTTAGVLLGLTIGCLALGLAIAFLDAGRYRRRTGY